MNIYQLACATSGFVFLTTAGVTSASSAVFNFSYSGSNINGSVNVSGMLTTEAYNSTNSSYQITGITGTRNGVQIDSLLTPNSSFLEDKNDNLLFSSSPQVDFFGFSYSAAGTTYNLFSLPTGGADLYGEKSINGVITPITFSATPAPVPEPSSIPSTLIMGVLLGGALLKRKLWMR